MTEPRIRWTDSRNSPDEPAFTGSAGDLHSLFRIWPPENPGDEWLLTSPLPGMEGERCYGFPDDLKGEAEHWLTRFISSLGAVFAGGSPDGNAIEAYCATKAGDGDERHLLQYAVRLPDGTARTYGDQSWVMSGQGAREHEEGSSTVVRDIWVSYGPWRTHQTTAPEAGRE